MSEKGAEEPVDEQGYPAWSGIEAIARKVTCDHRWTGWIRSTNRSVSLRRCHKCLVWERKEVVRD